MSTKKQQQGIVTRIENQTVFAKGRKRSHYRLEVKVKSECGVALYYTDFLLGVVESDLAGKQIVFKVKGDRITEWTKGA
jgi:hypothetical protein